MAATEITLVTPITIPRIVSAERILRARSVSKATSRFSVNSWRVILLRAQRCYRIELGRFYRRIDAEKHSNDGAEDHAQRRHPSLHGRRKAGEFAQRERAAETDHDANSAAHHALQHAFHEELAQDIRLRGSHGAPYADLLSSLGD